MEKQRFQVKSHFKMSLVVLQFTVFKTTKDISIVPIIINKIKHTILIAIVHAIISAIKYSLFNNLKCSKYEDPGVFFLDKLVYSFNICRC